LSFRKEKKYRVTISDYHKFQDQLYNQGMLKLFESRFVKSIYFDTADLKMFRDSEEGVLPRKKVRIRWYNNEKIFTLENKISSVEGRYKVTNKLDNNVLNNGLLCNSRIDRMYGAIYPVLKVSYERSYFMFNQMRITFDKNIIYENLKYVNKRKYYESERVIEIKIPPNCSDDFLEKYIQYPTTRFSKYSRGCLFSLGDLCEA
jgi:hypothetical protein